MFVTHGGTGGGGGEGGVSQETFGSSVPLGLQKIVHFTTLFTTRDLILRT